MSSGDSIKVEAPDGAPPPTQPVPDTGGQRNRRGKGSKGKQAEKFRSKKNQTFDADLEAKIQSIKISLGYSTVELFGERRISPLVHPQVEVPINTESVGYLCDSVAEVLHGACKVPPSEDVPEGDDPIAFDAETLKWVTSLQLESKFFHARSGTEYLPDLHPEVSARVQRVDALLQDALIPLSVFVDQVGRANVNEQMIVPGYSGLDFVYSQLARQSNPCRVHIPTLIGDAPVGVRTEHRDHLGRIMYVHARDEGQIPRLVELQIFVEADGQFQFNPEFLLNPHQFPYFGLVDFVPGPEVMAPPPFELIIARYANLRGRVNKKLTNVFVTTNLTAGIGCESQIVYMSRIGNSSTYEVWSPRAIRSDSMEIGSILQLGYVCDFGQRQVALLETVVDTSAGLETLANVLTRKIR